MKLPRSLILISAKNASEVQTLFETGIAWIDLKNPAAGSLGCPSMETIDEVLLRISMNPSTEAKLSLALGDLELLDELPLRADQAARFSMLKLAVLDVMAETKAIEQQLAKLELWQRQVSDAVKEVKTCCVSKVLDSSTRLRSGLPFQPQWVLAFYADLYRNDSEAWPTFLKLATQAGTSSVLIDTQLKDGRSTLEHCGEAKLGEMIAVARTFGQDVMLAGSLRLHDLPIAWKLGAKIIGIRSAVCQENSRVAGLDPDRLQQLAKFWHA